MPRPAPLATDRYLDARECADLRHVSVSRWWRLASSSLVLKRGCLHDGGRTLWLESAVVRYLRSLAGTGTSTRGANAAKATAARLAGENA